MAIYRMAVQVRQLALNSTQETPKHTGNIKSVCDKGRGGIELTFYSPNSYHLQKVDFLSPLLSLFLFYLYFSLSIFSPPFSLFVCNLTGKDIYRVVSLLNIVFKKFY